MELWLLILVIITILAALLSLLFIFCMMKRIKMLKKGKKQNKLFTGNVTRLKPSLPLKWSVEKTAGNKGHKKNPIFLSENRSSKPATGQDITDQTELDSNEMASGFIALSPSLPSLKKAKLVFSTDDLTHGEDLLSESEVSMEEIDLGAE